MGIQKTNITIPRQPRSGLDVLLWAKDVNYALKQLSGISANQSRSKKNAMMFNSLFTPHPWKATANGDDTVSIAQGYIMSWGTSGTLSFETDFVEFAGADVTVTASGSIWAVVLATEVPGATYSWFTADGTVTVELDPTLGSDAIHFKICDVTLTDGIAAVTKQYLRQDISMPM